MWWWWWWWWSEAISRAQVISRAHRMGAKGPVVVEQLVMAGTVEEVLLGMHAEKCAEKSAEEVAEKTAEAGAARMSPPSPITPCASKSARKRPMGGAAPAPPPKRGRGIFSAGGWLVSKASKLVSGRKDPSAGGAEEVEG